MNITELHYLVAIMQWGSVSAAAKQLYAAQPNISKALKNLEEEYHIRIFERSSTGMIPTEQGRRFIEQAARVLEEVDRLTEDAHHARERCAELRVMIPHATYASYAAVDFLKEAAGADQLRIHIREGGWTSCCAGVITWRCCGMPPRTTTTTSTTAPAGV